MCSWRERGALAFVGNASTKHRITHRDMLTATGIDGGVVRRRCPLQPRRDIDLATIRLATSDATWNGFGLPFTTDLGCTYSLDLL